MKLSWDDLFKHVDLVGCDIETREAGHLYRGPISAVVQKEGYIQFRTAWVASRPVATGDDAWTEEYSHDDILCGGCTDFIQGPSLYEEEGCIGFRLPYIGSVRVYLGGSRLVRKMVPVFALKTLH